MGNWSDAEYWNHVSKLPITSSPIDNYMYVVDCVIGDYVAHTDHDDWSLCVFDSTTSISSIFGEELEYTVIDESLHITHDSSYVNNGKDPMVVETLGLNFTGIDSSVGWCIGNYDPHTTICIEHQRMALLTAQNNAEDAQYELPFRLYHEPVQAIIGLGAGDPATDPYGEFNLIQSAYEEGLLKNNTYSF